MSDLRELYRDLIVDHGRKPRNFGKLEGANRKATGYNPLCGDRITVYLEVEDDVVREIRFDGVCCGIATASASLMTENCKGKTCAELEALFEVYLGFLTGGEPAEAAPLGDLTAFSGLKSFPLRVECAAIPWHTLRAALRGEDLASRSGDAA